MATISENQEFDIRIVRTICVGLTIAVVSIFGRTAWFDFINFDDAFYVYQNPMVNRGLTADGVIWAFTRIHSANWHALTWLSHMLDCQMYGLWAGGHHLTNVVLHAINAVLLFLALLRMTAEIWPSAFAAALFAVHPLRVESVAWVSERKDVLSGLLFMLTLAAYTRFAASNRFSLGRYLAVVVMFSLGLLAKPMLVTLPCLLLLLDVWPLQRLEGHAQSAVCAFRQAKILQLIAEKAPLLAVAAVASAVTVHAQSVAMHSMVEVLPTERFRNAMAATLSYIRMFWIPTNLAIYYPLDVSRVTGAQLAFTTAVAAVLVAISGIVWLRRGVAPWMFVGWHWYLGMLVPVSGILQAGGQSRADRFTYLPQIGLAIMVAYGVNAWATSVGSSPIAVRRRHKIILIAAAVWLGVLAAAAYCQTGHWSNSETIWRRALDVTSRNGLAHYMLGHRLQQVGQSEEALDEYLRAVEIYPDRKFVEAAARNGRRLVVAGRRKEARAVYQALVDGGGTAESMLMDMANLLLEDGDTAKAAAYRDWAFRECAGDKARLAALGPTVGLMELPSPPRPSAAVRVIAPDVRRALAAGMRHAREKQYDAAIASFRQATTIDPACAEAYNNIGMASSQLRRDSEAERAFQRAIAIDPTRSDYHVNLANVLFTLERWDDAAASCERALRIDPLDVETAALLARAEARRSAN